MVAAHKDMGSVVAKFEPKIGIITKQILGYAASAHRHFKVFGCLVVSGIWMAYASSGHAAAIDIAKRMAGPEKGRPWSSFRRRPSVQWRRVIALHAYNPCYWGRVYPGWIPAAGILALLALLLGIVARFCAAWFRWPTHHLCVFPRQ